MLISPESPDKGTLQTSDSFSIAGGGKVVYSIENPWKFQLQCGSSHCVPLSSVGGHNHVRSASGHRNWTLSGSALPAQHPAAIDFFPLLLVLLSWEHICESARPGTSLEAQRIASHERGGKLPGTEFSPSRTFSAPAFLTAELPAPKAQCVTCRQEPVCAQGL